MNVAIILAGGTETRVGASVPKQFIEIEGKPILAYILEVFQKDSNIDAIEIVCHMDWLDHTKKISEGYGITKTRWITVGGSTFQESTMKGVFNLKDTLKDDDIVGK